MFRTIITAFALLLTSTLARADGGDPMVVHVCVKLFGGNVVVTSPSVVCPSGWYPLHLQPAVHHYFVTAVATPSDEGLTAVQALCDPGDAAIACACDAAPTFGCFPVADADGSVVPNGSGNAVGCRSYEYFAMVTVTATCLRRLP